MHTATQTNLSATQIASRHEPTERARAGALSPALDAGGHGLKVLGKDLQDESVRTQTRESREAPAAVQRGCAVGDWFSGCDSDRSKLSLCEGGRSSLWNWWAEAGLGEEPQ